MPEIEDSEYYIYELIGMLVKYEDGEIVGEVKDIMQTKANDILMIEKKVTEYKSEETLIPLIQNFIVEMDKKNNIIIAKRMEWMEDETQDKD
jgi:16S rRNA processing protein RimM